MNDVVHEEVRQVYTRKIRAYAEAAQTLEGNDRMQILVLIALCCEAMTGSETAKNLLRNIEEEVGTR